MREYRIGEFAKHLGVTPDLLKHYEDQGIITPSRSESGYRYYPFQTSMLLMECVRLRNYGMTLREIREIVTAHQVDNAAVDRRLSENMSSLREEMLLDEALTANYEAFLAWKAPLQGREYDWDVRWSRPMCFLPHTDKYDFLRDPRIYEILKAWMSYIPIVKSTMKVERNGQITWGLIAEEESVRSLRLPVNDVVERIPQKKIFYYKFRAPLIPTDLEQVDAPEHPAFQTLQSLNLHCEDWYFRTTLMPADWQQDLRYQYGYYAIPIADG
ncbi:MAG: MerR family transcriptional regulator [Oscillospiraceae bacterium]|nr:MerR family transcriptional regulator [Oscillospiraceae bacterium]